MVYYVLTCRASGKCLLSCSCCGEPDIKRKLCCFSKFTVPQSASELSLFLTFSLGKCYRDFLSRGVFLKCDAGLLEVGLDVNGS